MESMRRARPRTCRSKRTTDVSPWQARHRAVLSLAQFPRAGPFGRAAQLKAPAALGEHARHPVLGIELSDAGEVLLCHSEVAGLIVAESGSERLQPFARRIARGFD